MSDLKYNKRVWLNKEGSASNGNAVAFCAKEKFNDAGEKFWNMFLSISDCHVSARLHKSYVDTPYDFIEKLKLLKYTISDFVDFLEKNQSEFDKA